MESVALLRLVSESTRHAILSALRRGPCTVGELVAAIGGEQSNVSHHLRHLRHAGLLVATKRGREQTYRLSDDEIGDILSRVENLGAKLDAVAYQAAVGIPTDAAFHGYG